MCDDSARNLRSNEKLTCIISGFILPTIPKISETHNFMKVAYSAFMKGKAAAIVILISAILFVPMARVSGVGMMPQEPSAVNPNPNPSTTTPSTENQKSPNLPEVNCLTDEWWSPVLAEVVVNQCTPAQTTNGQEPGNIPPVTKTKDKEGKTTLTLKDENKKNKVETEISSSLTAEEEGNFERCYYKGFTSTYSNVNSTVILSHDFLVSTHFRVTPDSELACMVGWFNGVSAALEAQDLTRNTLEALGINKIPTDLKAFRDSIGSTN